MSVLGFEYKTGMESKQRGQDTRGWSESVKSFAEFKWSARKTDLKTQQVEITHEKSKIFKVVPEKFQLFDELQVNSLLI